MVRVHTKNYLNECKSILFQFEPEGGTEVKNAGAKSFFTLCDPKTIGGLMVTIFDEPKNNFEKILQENNLIQFATPVGRITDKADVCITINDKFFLTQFFITN